MLAQLLAGAMMKLEGHIIDIECDMANVLPSFVMVGLADKAGADQRNVFSAPSAIVAWYCFRND